MTAPDRVWVDAGFQPWRVWTIEMADLPEYTRRDPAALAADPMVMAMQAAALEGAVGVCDKQAEYRAEQMKNDTDAGREQIQRWLAGRTQSRLIGEAIRALTPADARAALDEAISRAREVKPLVWEEVAENHWSSGDYHIADACGQGPGKLMLGRGVRVLGWFDDDVPAKAAAQADHTARIHAALAPVEGAKA